MLIAFSSGKAFSQDVSFYPPEKSRLIVGIVIDQLKLEDVYRYWDKFSEKGFHRLINKGTICKNAYYNYLFTENGPACATIATGTEPAHHGIVSDKWYNRLREEVVFCDIDPKTHIIGKEDVNGFSPHLMLSTTFADEIRLHNNFKSKVIGVSMNEKSAIFTSGHTANAAYWLDFKNGNWITSSYYCDSLPAWVDTFNNRNLQDIYLDRKWEPLLRIGQYTECLPDNCEYEKGICNQHTFPYNLTTLKAKTGGYDLLQLTPFGNTYTKDFALAAIINEELGKDEYTDVITVNFSVNKYISDIFSSRSLEMADVYLRLDKEIAHLMEFIDEQIGTHNTLVFLTAENVTYEHPDYLKAHNIPGGFFSPVKSMVLLESYLKAIYGPGKWIKYYHNQQFYLNHKLIEDSKHSLNDLQDRVAQFIIQFSGIANAIPAHVLKTNNLTNGILNKAKNNFYPQRSGDIFLIFNPGWIEKYGYETKNPYKNKSRVPLIWYGWNIGHGAISTAVNITDIAPTIGYLLNISYPNACTGKPIIGLEK